MKYGKIYLFILAVVLFSSCNDWLTVTPQNKTQEDDLFKTGDGYRVALNGLYQQMSENSLYGQELTWGFMSVLSQNYVYDNLKSQRYKDAGAYEYGTSGCSSIIDGIWRKLYNTIANCNNLLQRIETENPGLFELKELERNMIMGEAYSIRAFCQLDVLRLFGQMPQGASRQVELPYSETTSIDEMPAYYSFDDYVVKLESDLSKAESLLKDNDPLFQYTFSELNSANRNELSDSYMYYRQSRMNYWAVKAIQARMYLYLGKKDKAYMLAKEIIEAKGADGELVMTMSGETDIAKGYKACPSECLLYLSKYDVKTYSSVFLIGNKVDQQAGAGHLVISSSMLSDLYAGQNTGSHNRYLNCWNRNVKDASANLYGALTKYYFADDAENQMLYYQIIPLLRMSEIYLIAMETSSDLDEINEWYHDYMLAHSVVLNEAGFSALSEVPGEMVNEYRREFYGEGQMFYTYKRTGATTILWGNGNVDENVYIVPLPETEYNPNSQIK